MRLLVAGDPASIHTARFVDLLQSLGHEVHLFQSAPHYTQDEHLHDVTIYVAHPIQPARNGNRIVVTFPFRFEMRPGSLERPLRRMARILNRGRPRALELVKLIRRLKPDLIISLKMQNDGYTVSAAKGALGGSLPAPWLHFCWGTDIEFFGKHRDYAGEHLPKIREVLSGCDYLMADTERDLRQARELGFGGTILGAFPAHGGFDLGHLRGIRSAHRGRRDIILVKGRQGSFVGHGMNILRALDGIAPQLAGYRVVVLLASPDIKAEIDAMTRRNPALPPITLAENLPYDQLLALYAQSRIAISATEVDGTPSFLIEAMALGALPIHSDMESVREWIEDGRNGLLFPVQEIDRLAAAIRRGLEDDTLSLSARERNWAITEDRMDRAKIGGAIGQALAQIAAGDARIKSGHDGSGKRGRTRA